MVLKHFRRSFREICQDSREVDLKHVDWIFADVYQIVDNDIAESISPCSKVVIHVLKSRIENWKLIINPYGLEVINPW